MILAYALKYNYNWAIFKRVFANPGRILYYPNNNEIFNYFAFKNAVISNKIQNKIL